MDRGGVLLPVTSNTSPNSNRYQPILCPEQNQSSNDMLTCVPAGVLHAGQALTLCTLISIFQVGQLTSWSHM